MSEPTDNPQVPAVPPQPINKANPITPSELDYIENVHKNGKRGLTVALYRRGLTEEKIADKLADGLSAIDSRLGWKDGNCIERVDLVDFKARFDYLKLLCEIRGDLKNQEVNVNVGLIAIPSPAVNDNEWNVVDGSKQHKMESTVDTPADKPIPDSKQST